MDSPTRRSFDSHSSPYGSSPSSSSSSSLASIAQSNTTSPTLVDFDSLMVEVHNFTPLKWPITPEHPKEDPPNYFAQQRTSLLRTVSFTSTKSDASATAPANRLRSKISVPSLLSPWKRSSRRRADSITNTSVSSASTVSARTSDDFSHRKRSNSVDSSASSAEIDTTDCAPARSNFTAYCADDTAATRQSDRRTCELLTTLAQGSPSFLAYGKSAPRKVLDLGCGDGSWIVMAAQRWPTTEFIGLDIRKRWPSEDDMREKHGLTGSYLSRIQFHQGNFLCDLAQFPPDSFDLVRMSYLGLALNKGSWRNVLSDVRRILTVSGRIEFIDEAPIFPSDEPFEFGLADAGEDIASVLEIQFKHMLAARGLLKPAGNVRESFWDRPAHCLSTYVGAASSVAAFDILLPAHDGDDLGERTLRAKKSMNTVRILDDLSAKSRKDTLQVPPSTPIGLAPLESKLLVQSTDSKVQHTLRMTALDAQLHASRNLQLLLSHTEALWKHFETSHPTAVSRAQFDNALWQYECAQRERLGLDPSNDPVDEWDDSAFSFPVLKKNGDALPGIPRRVRAIQVWEAHKTLA